MKLTESLALALKNIVSSKVRTLLTMLGIIIGVAAVIVIVGLGNGLEQYVTDSFSDLGTNTLTVTVMSRGSTRSLDADDMYELVEENSQYLDPVSYTHLPQRAVPWKRQCWGSPPDTSKGQTPGWASSPPGPP